MRLFLDEGVAAVSMRRLAQEADCTTMTIYSHFDSKNDILRVLWEHVFHDLFDVLEHLAAKIENPVERLAAMAEAYVGYWLDNRDHYSMVFMSPGVERPDVNLFAKDGAVVRRFRLFHDAMEEAIRHRGHCAPAGLRSEVLLCVLNGIAQNLITVDSIPWSEPGRLIRRALDGLLCDC